MSSCMHWGNPKTSLSYCWVRFHSRESISKENHSVIVSFSCWIKFTFPEVPVCISRFILLSIPCGFCVASHFLVLLRLSALWWVSPGVLYLASVFDSGLHLPALALCSLSSWPHFAFLFSVFIHFGFICLLLHSGGPSVLPLTSLSLVSWSWTSPFCLLW